MVVDKYLSKAEVLSWCNVQKQGTLTVDDIPDDIMGKAHAKVDATIVSKNCWTIMEGIPTESDPLDFLKYATQSYALALLCKAGLITQTTGELLTNKFGDVMYQFQRAQPMFFFATGASEPFMDLLPYETFRMYGYSYIKAYCKYRFYVKNNHPIPKLKAFVDKSSRGAYWNIPYSEHDVADGEYGEIIEEEVDY